MFHNIRRASTLGAVTLALFASASTAQALEGKALFEQLMTQAPGTSLAFESVAEEAGGSFTMKGVTLTKNGSQQLLTIGTITMRGFKEAEGGRIVYDAIGINDVVATGTRPGKATISEIITTSGDIPLEALKKRVPAEMKTQRVKLGNFTINDMKMSELPDGLSFGFKNVTLVNADVPLDFRYKDKNPQPPFAAPLTFDKFEVAEFGGTQKGVVWSIGSMNMADAQIPTAANVPVGQLLRIYSTFSMNNMSVNLGPLNVFKMGELSATLTPPDASGTTTSSSTLNGLFVNLKAIPDPKTKAITQQLGYDKVEGSMTATGSYNPTTGKADVSDLSMKLKDMVDLNMKYAITGYTEEVLRKIQEVQVQIAGGTAPMQAYGSVLPTLSNVKLEGLSLRLTDRSLTGRLLDFQGKQMGMSGEQLANGAPMMLGLGMVNLNMPAFTEALTTAVGKFLKDKGTLSFTAEPAAPVALTDIMVASQTDVKKIPELLNIKITAQ